MPACNRRVAADYRSRGPLGKKTKRGRAKKRLQGARLAASFFGPHAAMPVTARIPGAWQTARGVLLQEGEEMKGRRRGRDAGAWGRCSVFCYRHSM